MVSAKSVLIAASFGLLATGSSVAQTASPTPDACVGAPWDAFDFWVGTWNVYAPDNGDTPGAIGKGVGRDLFEDAKAKLKARGETVMTILSDPYAEAAYIHMGAKRVAMRPSAVFKGRELPWLEVEL